jgi:hypothetical protein
MDTAPEPYQRITGIIDAALRPLQCLPHDPLVKLINTQTGGTIVTRDVAVYRLGAVWQERPVDRLSPVPRRRP